MSFSIAGAAALGAGSAGGSGLFGMLNTRYAALQNWKSYKKQRALDWQYDSENYYDLSRRYAENSARWQMNGLKSAGINPILAAVNGNIGTFGPGSSGGGSAGSVGAPSAPDFAGSMSSIASGLSSKQQADTAKEVANAQVSNLKLDNSVKAATVKQIEAQSRNIDSSTALNNQRTTNAFHTGGHQGPYALFHDYIRRIPSGIENLGKGLHRLSDNVSGNAGFLKDKSVNWFKDNSKSLYHNIRRLVDSASQHFQRTRGGYAPSVPVNSGKMSERMRHEMSIPSSSIHSAKRRRHN